MNVLIVTDFPVWKKDTRVYTKPAFSTIIQRYGDNLGKISVACPVIEDGKLPEFCVDITAIVVKTVAVGTVPALLHKRNPELNEEIQACDIVVGRFGGFVSLYCFYLARKKQKPLFAEVMSCTWDAFWNHGILGKVIAPYMFLATKKAIKKADYALYVTEKFLQNRYPCDANSIGVSNVVFPDIEEKTVKIRKEKILNTDKENIVLMTCAAVNVQYKGQQYVIEAIPKLNRLGIKVKYYCVGQGSAEYLKNVARKYNVEDQVVFTGTIEHDKIFELLDECDIYVQPSLQEGLPRSLIEAMSRGCPCIGAKTGGIPELLPEECVFKRKSAEEISQKIELLLEAGLDGYVDKSFEKAKEFQKNILDEKRNSYFNRVKI